MKKAAFIGSGNMGGALIRAACRAIGPDQVLIADAQRDNVLYVVEREASYGGKDRITCLGEDIAWLKENL